MHVGKVPTIHHSSRCFVTPPKFLSRDNTVNLPLSLTLVMTSEKNFMTEKEELIVITYAVFTLELFTAVAKFINLGKIFVSVNDS